MGLLSKGQDVELIKRILDNNDRKAAITNVYISTFILNLKMKRLGWISRRRHLLRH